MTDLWRLNATDLAARIRGKQVSANEAAKDALARLAAVNPKINAVVDHRPEETLADAARIDAMIARGEDAGPLAGVPITIKVNMDQQGYATTNGLRLQKDLIAKQDNPVVANLRKAGAVIVGRTNTPAFSLRWFTRNSLHGHTRNPHNPRITPGGSSGGAAAATAAGIGAMGHGTDIGGSIRTPCNWCGIYGHKPTYGVIPQRGHIPGPPGMLSEADLVVVGPMARSAGDLELLLGLSGRSGVAHFAHLGGMLGAWLLLMYWRGKSPFGGTRRRR